jgi:imidazolonepropionase-like amidohydrolase
VIEGIRIARAAGVRIGSGADLTGPKQDIRGMEPVLRSEVEDPMAALVSATSANADIFGIADEVGTVEAGKRADLVVFDGNPLDDPDIFNAKDRVVLIIQNGKCPVGLRELGETRFSETLQQSVSH